ncbi:MAG TPA: SCO family protein [Sphingomicrobium sp.]|nr:SCO family protein [Sphingomicrobium sp.]
MMRKLRILLWIMVALSLAGFAFLLLRGRAEPSPPTVQTSTVDFGGPFTLTGSDGRPFSSQRLAGRPHAVFFGFTHCPDVCPTTLARMVKLRQQLGSEDSFEILFVTVDPERDGPEEVGKYADLFGSPVIGLTGSPARIQQVQRQFGIYSRKSPDDQGGYSVDHTASVLLFGRDGRFVATISPEENDSVALGKLRRIAA